MAVTSVTCCDCLAAAGPAGRSSQGQAWTTAAAAAAWAVGFVIGGFVVAGLGCVAVGVKVSADHRRRKRAVAAHMAHSAGSEQSGAEARAGWERSEELTTAQDTSSWAPATSGRLGDTQLGAEAVSSATASGGQDSANQAAGVWGAAAGLPPSLNRK